jgi:hypothetical protein
VTSPPSLAAVLPLKLSGRHYSDNLSRLDILLSSLLHFAEADFVDELLVVTPAGEVPMVRQYLGAWPELPVCLMVEEDFFPAFARYRRPWQVRPWQRQQIIKLAAPLLTSASFVLTLDPDVFVVRPVRRSHLFPDGRALLEPEPRSTHASWWAASAAVLEVPDDPDAPGMSVTPALLSRDVLESMHRRIEGVSGRGWIDTLLTTYDDWTEYTLYLLEAERTGLVDAYHRWAGSLGCPDHLQVAATRSVWSRRESTAGAVTALFDGNGHGLFAVVQSNIGMPAAEVQAAVADALPLRRTPALDLPTSGTVTARLRLRLVERLRTASRLVASGLYSVRRSARRRGSFRAWRAG